MASDTERHACPFEGCPSSYKTQKGLKNHLISINGAESFDRLHNKEHPLWAQLKADGFFTVVSSNDHSTNVCSRSFDVLEP